MSSDRSERGYFPFPIGLYNIVTNIGGHYLTYRERQAYNNEIHGPPVVPTRIIMTRVYFHSRIYIQVM